MLSCLLLFLFASLPVTFVFAEESAPVTESSDTVVEKTTPSGIPLSRLEGFVDAYVADYIGKTVPGAAIVVLKDNEIVLSKGYGYADIEKKINVDPETTVFEWGSVTKLFTWTAVMQLVEQGKLDLNEDIRTYLPEGFLRKLHYDDPITMLDLMHHTAGFEEYVYDLAYSKPEQVKPLAEALQRSQPRQMYRPGEVVSYSNFGTALAGYIVERITGQAFYRYVTEQIFNKIGSNDTSIHPTWRDKPELLEKKAKGYIALAPEKFMESVWFYVSMYPAGSANGPATDLAKFANALMPGAETDSPLFEHKDTLDDMLTQSYSAHENMPGNAHGFWEYAGTKRGLSHGGNTAAFSSNFHIVPEENFAVVILTNQGGETDLCLGLMGALVGKKEISLSGEKLPPASEVEGLYTMARRHHGGFFNLYYALTSMKVEAVSENEIKVSMSGVDGKYVQTSPYVYEKTEGHAMLDLMGPAYFHVKDGKVSQISMAITDFLPLSVWHSTPVLIVTGILGGVSILYFIIAPFVLLVRGVLRKRKGLRAKGYQRWHSALVLSGTALVLNIILLMVRMLLNPFSTYGSIWLQIGLNYVFTALSLVSLAMGIVKRRNTELTKAQKFWYGVSAVLTLIFILLMIYWQLYSAL